MPGIFEADQRDSGLVLQELADSYFLAQADAVPFTALLSRGEKPSGFLLEYPMKKRARRAVAGVVDGTDQASYGHTNRERVQVYAQEMRSKGWMATNQAVLTRTGGVQDEAAEQELDDGIEWTLQLERLLLSNQDTQAAAMPSSAYLLRGVYQWLNPSAQATLPVPADFRPASATRYSGALSAFNPDNLEAMLTSASEARLEPVNLTLFAGIRLKSRMSKWAQRDTDVSGETFIQRYSIAAEAKRYARLVQFFTFDAGEVQTVLSYNHLCDLDTGEDTAYTSRSGVGVDVSNWELRFLEEMNHNENPDLGGGPRGFHRGTMALCAKNLLGQVSVYSNS